MAEAIPENLRAEPLTYERFSRPSFLAQRNEQMHAAEEAEANEATEEDVPAMPYADLLHAAGYTTEDAVQGALDEDLLKVPGIGPARLAEIRAYFS